MSDFSPQALMRMGLNSQTGQPEAFPSNITDDPETLIQLYLAHPEQFRMHDNAPTFRDSPLSPEEWAAVQQVSQQNGYGTPNKLGAFQRWVDTHLPNPR